MLQKQNHKPISVTLAMRLDGTDLSPLGAIGFTPVSHKRPLSSRQSGSLLFADNSSWTLVVHVTATFGDMTAGGARAGVAGQKNNKVMYSVP